MGISALIILSLAAVNIIRTEDASIGLANGKLGQGCQGFICSGKYEECILIARRPFCAKKCPECKVKSIQNPVCASDGKTYDDLCRLKQAECMENIVIEPLCKGKCPCDPKEVEKMDPGTVHKLEQLRLQIHIDRRFKKEMQEETAAEEALRAKAKNPKVFGADTPEAIEKLHSKKMKKWYKKKVKNGYEKSMQKEKVMMQGTKQILGKDACSKSELTELPSRLIDWFHVLKSNEIQSANGQSEKRTIKEMTFLDAKLKAMYVTLACKKDPNRPDSEVFCLQPVQWMFDHLDINKNGILESIELADLENVNSEHCMKRFFLGCDRNRNGTVEKTEFCRCLCVEPPCTKAIENIPTVLIAGVPRPVPGLFIPKCNEDGFYIGKQCTDKECFCVDRNGLEIPETRIKGQDLQCADNTNPQEQNQEENIDE